MYALIYTATLMAAPGVEGTNQIVRGALPDPNLYEILDEPGSLYVLTKPASLLGFLAHEHVIEARAYTGQIAYDPSHPDACRITLDIPVEKLVVDRADFRSRLGIKKNISEKDRKKVDEHMRKPKQLNQSEFSMIQFRSVGCTPAKSDAAIADGVTKSFMVEGDLKIRGHVHRIKVPVEVVFEGDKLKATSDFSEVHESFGFKPYSAFAGTIKNDPLLRFRVRLSAKQVTHLETIQPRQ